MFLLAGWILYSWGIIQRDDTLARRWREIAPHLPAGDQLETLTREPALVLRRMCRHGRTLAILVDDADFLDAYSVNALWQLYQTASRSTLSSVFLVFAYNPRNPALAWPERSLVRSLLDPEEIFGDRATAIGLAPPTLTDLRGWLWGHYPTGRTTEVLDFLLNTYGRETADPGTLLQFFIQMDRQRMGEAHIGSLTDEQVRSEFERYLNRDKRVVGDVLEMIQSHELASECFEFLKFFLAFKKPQVRVDEMKGVMGPRFAETIDKCEQVLLSEQVNVLQKSRVEQSHVYEFRQPYLRGLMQARWRDWRENSEAYGAAVLEWQNRHASRGENPEVALGAAPSKLAVDALSRWGDHLFHYAGLCDSGTALRFYGLEHGGALRKWLGLCHDALQNDGDIWDLIRWKSASRVNPYRGVYQAAPPSETFAPDLLLTAGRLYWMIGRWETAKSIWDEYWSPIREALQDAPAPDADLAKLVTDADREMRETLAQMLLQVGARGSWNEAHGLTAGLVKGSSDLSNPNGGATICSSLIDYYRKVSIGNLLLPFAFLTKGELETLEANCAAVSNESAGRLHVLRTLAEARWQLVLQSGSPLTCSVNLDKISSWRPDPGLAQELENAVDEMVDTIESARSQLSRRPGRGQTPRRDVRVKEADMLFWEGIALLMQSRLFRLVAWTEFGRYAPLLVNRRRAQDNERFNACYAIGNQLQDFLRAKLLTKSWPAEFEKMVDSLEQIREKWPPARAEAIHTEEGRARKVTEDLLRSGSLGILAQCEERLRLAEAIYRGLGHRHGLAAVSFARAQMTRDADDGSESNQRPDWVDGLHRFIRLSHGELGYALEGIIAHLHIAKWAEAHDLYLGVIELQKATDWLNPQRLGFLKAGYGEASLRLGSLVGNMEAAPFSEDYVFGVFQAAAHALDGLGANPGYIAANELSGRQLDVRWWLAELSLRRAQREKIPSQREKLLNRAIQDCDYILKRVVGTKEGAMANHEVRARLVRGKALVTAGSSIDGLRELDQARAMAQRLADDFNELQALTVLISEVLSRSPDNPAMRAFSEKVFSQYIGRMGELAYRFYGNLDQLDPSTRLVLYRALTLLATVVEATRGDPKQVLDF